MKHIILLLAFLTLTISCGGHDGGGSGITTQEVPIPGSPDQTVQLPVGAGPPGTYLLSPTENKRQNNSNANKRFDANGNIIGVYGVPYDPAKKK